MNLFEIFQNFIKGLGTYTAIPFAIIFFVDIDVYNPKVFFPILVLVNWIVVAEFKMRDTKREINDLKEEVKKFRVKKKK